MRHLPQLLAYQVVDHRRVSCRLARPARAARSSEVSGRARRQRLVEGCDEGAAGSSRAAAPVPTGRSQTGTARPCARNIPISRPPSTRRVVAARVQPGEGVEQLVLVVGHHPAEVLAVADRGPVRRLHAGQPLGRRGRLVGLLERGRGGAVLVVDVGEPEVEAAVHGDLQRLVGDAGPGAAGRRRAPRCRPTTRVRLGVQRALRTAARSRLGSPYACCTCRPEPDGAVGADQRRGRRRAAASTAARCGRASRSVSGAVADGDELAQRDQVGLEGQPLERPCGRSAGAHRRRLPWQAL